MEDNKCIHVTFCAYIIILVVSDELNEMDEAIIKIKNDVKFVRSSHTRLMSFKKCIEKLKVQSKIWVFFRCPNSLGFHLFDVRYNCKLEKVFDRLEEDGLGYLMLFSKVDSKGEKKKHVGHPSILDW